MDDRQSGQINVFAFLILLVLFLGAVGFSYVTLDEKTKGAETIAELREEISITNKRLRLQEDYIEDITAPIGMKGTYSGRQRTMADYDGETLTAVADPAQVQAFMQESAGSFGVPKMDTIAALMGQVKSRLDASEKGASTASTARDTAISETQAFQTQLAEATTGHRSAVQDLNTQATDAKKAYDQNVQEVQNQLNSTREDVRSKVKEMTTFREDFASEKRKLVRDLEVTKATSIAILEADKLKSPPDLADGKVIAAQPGANYAVIDLGRNDQLTKGTIFRVYAKNGAAIKSYARVTSVDSDTAKVYLYDIVDPVAGPISVGDELKNELYDPNYRRTVTLIGRFGFPYSRTLVEATLRSLNNQVVSEWRPGVDLVILGNDPINEAGNGFVDLTADKDYQAAVKFGAEFAPLQKIKDLLNRDN